MQIRVGFEMVYDFPQVTPLIAMVGTHFTRASDVIVPDHLITSPSVPITPYRDSFGNWCSRFVAPPGRMRFFADGRVRDSGVPDVVVPNRVAAKHDKALQEALGANVPKFRDAMVDYAIALKTSHGVTSPGFEVTPAMRDELYRRLRARGIVVDRAVYDSAQTLVNRALGGQITRFVFGTQAEYARTLREDAGLAKARELLRGASTPDQLVRRQSR